MALRDVPEPPFDPAEFVKFAAVGDKFGGWFLDKKKGTYGTDWAFRNKDGRRCVITAKGGLNAQLEASKLEQGHLVIITRLADVMPPGFQKGLWKFKVQADDAPAHKMPPPAAPKPAAAAQPAPDDVPF